MRGLIDREMAFGGELMQTHELSPTQLRQIGIEALVQALGAVGMARFLHQFDRGSGDYTCDRDTILAGITLEAAIAQINLAREGKR
jgi:hypothetical protein